MILQYALLGRTDFKNFIHDGIKIMFNRHLFTHNRVILKFNDNIVAEIFWNDKIKELDFKRELEQLGA